MKIGILRLGNEGRVLFYIQCLAVIGVVLAIFLLFEQVTQPAVSPCYVNSRVNCEAVISGSVARTLGIPTPIYGLVGYIVIFAASIFRKKKLLLFMAAFGLAFCLWIAFREIVQLNVLCPICIGCQLNMIAVFSLAVLIRKKSREV